MDPIVELRSVSKRDDRLVPRPLQLGRDRRSQG
jgi:hypothetical protein